MCRKCLLLFFSIVQSLRAPPAAPRAAQGTPSLSQVAFLDSTTISATTELAEKKSCLKSSWLSRIIQCARRHDCGGHGHSSTPFPGAHGGILFCPHGPAQSWLWGSAGLSDPPPLPPQVQIHRGACP